MKQGDMDALCLRWPGATVDIKWEDARVYAVAGKMFALVRQQADAATLARLCFKVPDELFLTLTDQPGIVPAPYLARARWVMLEDARRHRRAWIEQQLRSSYELVFAKLPKKTRAAIAAL